jgi:hypothetical protein
MEFPKQSRDWHTNSNYLAVLQVDDEDHLLEISKLLYEEGVRHVQFREPDIGYTLTALAIEPGDHTRRICSKLPLALRGIGEGVDKHCMAP